MSSAKINKSLCKNWHTDNFISSVRELYRKLNAEITLG